jgi:hypothetical protein
MREIWKPITGYEGMYEVSNTGYVRSVKRTVMLKTKNGKDRPCLFKSRILKPYCKLNDKRNILPRQQIVLSKNGKTISLFVHALVAKAFVSNPYNYETVNHKDGNPLNNNAENLEWISLADNIRHAFMYDLIHTQKPVAQIDNFTGEILKVFPGESEACRVMGISQGKIGRAIRRNGTSAGYKWQYIDSERVTTKESWKGFQRVG